MHRQHNVVFCLFSSLVCFLALAHSFTFDVGSTKTAQNEQITFHDLSSPTDIRVNYGRLVLSQQWTAIGPFPAGMREHQLGAFPAVISDSLPNLFNLTHPVQIPSTYGKAGSVQAMMVEPHIYNTGNTNRARYSVRISYPDLDWSMIRQSTGWAGLQWQALSVTDLVITGNSIATLNINLGSAAEFTIMSKEEYINYSWDNTSFHTRWYNGDWYGYNSEGLDKASHVPGHVIRLVPGDYKLLVKSVYEVRIFGDMKKRTPDVVFDIDIQVLENSNVQAITTGQYGIAPDVVDGQMAGWGISFAIRNDGQEWVEVTKVELVGESAKVRQDL